MIKLLCRKYVQAVLVTRITKRIFVIGLLLALLSACGTNPPLAPVPVDQSRATPLYIIGPGDTVQVFVWGNPDLSTTVPVRPDGRITTPLVEDVQASGKTSTQLARDMEQYLARYVKNPVVTVYVTNFKGRFTEQVRVIGEAAKPASIPFRQNMTLLDVLIEVGGLTEFADGDSATVVRTKQDGSRQQFYVRLDSLVKRGNINANIEMMPVTFSSFRRLGFNSAVAFSELDSS